MSKETLRMSRQERERLIVMEQVEAGGMKLKDAARQMRVGYRQAKRIRARFRRRGAEGLVHASRGRVSNRRIDPAFRDRVLEIYRTFYWDFGPRLAGEKLLEDHGIEVHEETLRRWLLAAHPWQGRTAHRKHRRRRPRREHFGELVQLDGSDHLWFENRGARACLMVMIDDATGLCEALLGPAETIDAALAVLHQWIERRGVPAALYTDRKNIYVTDREPTAEERRRGSGALTPFGNACHRLGIKIIAARSPQAKGRVERRNGVFQDRWVKELRLAGISNIAAANAHLGPFTDTLNERLATEPLSPANHHRALPPGQSAKDALYLQETRRVDNDWTFPFRGRTFQIPPQPHAPRARRRVTIRRHTDGSIRCLYHGQPIRIEEIA
jgi:transposase